MKAVRQWAGRLRFLTTTFCCDGFLQTAMVS